MRTKSVTGFAFVAFFAFAGATVSISSLQAQDGHEGHSHEAEGHKDKHDHSNENAAAHKDHHPEPKNGGVVLEFGEHHGELVLTDGKIQLFLSDHDGKSIAPKGFSAVAMILSAQGRQGPFKLQGIDENFLQSSEPIAEVDGVRVVITLTDPHGHSSQARHQMP